MQVSNHQVFVERYTLIRNEVQRECPDAWRDVIALCQKIPGHIDRDVIWRHGKDKPCFSNIRVSVGERIADDLFRSPDFESCARIAGDDWAIDMMAPGNRWKANTNFRIGGESVRRFLEIIPRGGLASFRWRLYAIRQLALALCRNDQAGHALIRLEQQAQQMDGQEIVKLATALAKELGRGWGFVTANHLLTDLGLSVKSDLHVRRSAIRMGLLAQAVPEGLSIPEIDALSDKVDRQITQKLIDLSKSIDPTALPNPATTLREMDKTLMEWSRQGLARPLC